MELEGLNSSENNERSHRCKSQANKYLYNFINTQYKTPVRLHVFLSEVIASQTLNILFCGSNELQYNGND